MNYKFFLIPVLLVFGVHLKSETIEQYYANAAGKTGSELKAALHTKISVQTVLSYSEVWEALKNTDEDPDNSSNVILLYTGWSYPKDNNGGGATEWNREHTWAKSMGDFDTDPGPGTDIHHLRPTDVTVNSKRGNLYFDDGGTAYTDPSPYGGISGITGCYYDGDSWEPRDEVKGDVARMLFYMAVRYEQGDRVDLELAEYSTSSGLHGKLSTLLKWHEDDPVDQWEWDRNEKIYIEQGNRNPFINHPEYVGMIWGDNGNNGGDGFTNLFYEDFESVSVDNPITLSNWTVVNSLGANEWLGKEYNSNKYAQMTAYQGDASEVDWLVSPSIDLSGKSEVVLNFATKDGFDVGDVLEVFVSEDYGGDVNTASWVKLNPTLASGSASGFANNFTNSGDISLTGYSGTVYIAFKYTGGTGLTTTMQVDNILVKGKEIISAINDNHRGYIKVYPNPAKDNISLEGDGEPIKEVRIYNQGGQLMKFVTDYGTYSIIRINGFSTGLYYVRITDINGYTKTEKLLVK
ncbi:endonuclease [Saccharicrinis sp. GN24d3]|uniref:endonuclease n=1 Tax=Saccharicrinis sp. GN24d3 TaxID=3458416 RepID=UPI0040353D77